jgi:hypothetical protein
MRRRRKFLCSCLVDLTNGGMQNFQTSRLKACLSETRKLLGWFLRSVCYGTAAERRLYEDAVASITDDEKRAEFVAKWNDEKRTSMNNIMERAHKIADQLLSTATNEQ